MHSKISHEIWNLPLVHFCLQLDFLASANPLTHTHTYAHAINIESKRSIYEVADSFESYTDFSPLTKSQEFFISFGTHSARENAFKKSIAANESGEQIVFPLLFWMQRVCVCACMWMHESAFASGYQIRLIDTTRQ